MLKLVNMATAVEVPSAGVAEKLIHYSRDPLSEVRPVMVQRSSFKPQGLWVSVEGPDDWKSWCESEDFGLDRLVCASQIELSPTAKILRISGFRGIDTLTRKYYRGSGGYRLDWEAVAKKYDGIIIAPYVWERRLSDKSSWYYAWDCASGCIWNPSAVRSILPLY